MKKRIIIVWLMILCLLFSVMPAGAAESYTIRLQAEEAIYHGPGYEFGYARDVGERGIYTIVEECRDAHGHLWGRLKSGAGWVLLMKNEAPAVPFMAAYADEAFLAQGVYHQYIMEQSEYLVKIALFPQEEMYHVSLVEMALGEAGYDPARALCTFHRLAPDIPLVAGVIFFGDMTAYGLSFMDEGGNMRSFAFSISGKDGSLIAEEIK